MIRTSYIAYFTLSAFAAAGLALAQDQPAVPPQDQDQPPQSAQSQQDNQQQPAQQQNRGWRRVGDPAPPDGAANGDPGQAGPAATYPNGRYQGQPTDPNAYFGGGMPQQQQPQQQRPVYNRAPIPATLTLKPGTYLTVRVNQALSSDHNHAGDAFSATLVKPVIVDGVVVAAPGQTIGGRVAEAKKAGYVEGTSRLGVQLTDLTLVDGQNLPLQSQLISQTGPTSVGRDAGAIAGTTALGAAIGAGADWGRGAAIGAGAGAAAGILGVLLTRGRPTVVYPEETLTFRVDAPVTISTERAPQAFHWVQPGEYDGPQNLQRRPPPYGVAGAPAIAPYPVYYGPAYYYGPGYYPYYYGPSVGFYFGHGGYYRGWRR